MVADAKLTSLVPWMHQDQVGREVCSLEPKCASGGLGERKVLEVVGVSVSVIQVQVLYDALDLFLAAISEPCRANVRGQSRPHTTVGGGALIVMDGSFEVLESQLFFSPSKECLVFWSRRRGTKGDCLREQTPSLNRGLLSQRLLE